MSDATPVSELPNLGPKSAQVLESVGIRTLADLRKLGSVAAYARAKCSGSAVSLNLLWASPSLNIGHPQRQTVESVNPTVRRHSAAALPPIEA